MFGINDEPPLYPSYPSANMEKYVPAGYLHTKAAPGEYVTKDSGKRQEFSTGMKRDTETGKPRFDLVEPMSQPFNERMSTRLASLMARGASKYGDRNWEAAETPEELLRYLSSAERHFRQWVQQVKAQAGLSYWVDAGLVEAELMEEDHASATVFNITGAEYVKGRIVRQTDQVDKMLEAVKQDAELEPPQ